MMMMMATMIMIIILIILLIVVVVVNFQSLNQSSRIQDIYLKFNHATTDFCATVFLSVLLNCHTYESLALI